MKVFVAMLHEYVPDTPEILECTADRVLGVFTTKEAAEVAFLTYKSNITAIDSDSWDEGETFDDYFDGYFEVEEFELDANDYWAPWWPKKETTA